MYTKEWKIATCMGQVEFVDQPDQKFLGRRKVEYIGHQVSLAGFEAHPNDLG